MPSPALSSPDSTSRHLVTSTRMPRRTISLAGTTPVDSTETAQRDTQPRGESDGIPRTDADTDTPAQMEKELYKHTSQHAALAHRVAVVPAPYKRTYVVVGNSP
jgi:hypothetical protein